MRATRQYGTSNAWGISMRVMILGFVAAVTMLSASTTFAADERNVTVINGTGYGIKFLGFTSR